MLRIMFAFLVLFYPHCCIEGSRSLIQRWMAVEEVDPRGQEVGQCVDMYHMRLYASILLISSKRVRFLS